MALLIPALRRFRSVGRPSFVCTSIAQMVLSPIAIAVFLVAVLMAPRVSIAELEVFDYDRVLGSGMNLGDALDAPQEGAWGVILHSSYFRAIREAGFASVRIPIRWSAHAAAHSPYTIDPVFFRRVDWAINEALSQHLAAVIDVHHFIEMNQDPLGNSQKLLALWSQIAARYRDEPPNLFFELFNEPQDKFSDSRWNALLPQLLNVIRASNPTRMVIVGPGYWNSLHHLSTLQLPRDDQRLIVTFHYYEPFHFTHQAQPWLPASAAWKGTSWGSPLDRNQLDRDFQEVAAWAVQHHRPIYLGEFGAGTPIESKFRVAWTRAVVREAKTFHFSWAYWEFCSNFGIYDRSAGVWNQPMLDALMQEDNAAPRGSLH